MYKKEIERKWLVKVDKLPNLEELEYIDIKQGYLSQNHDSLMVRVRSESGKKFTLDLKDGDSKIRNEITFNISEEEFNIGFLLAGQKTISKRRFYVPSSKDPSRILELDIFKDSDLNHLIMVEYEAESEILVDTLIEEEWFGKEVTDDSKYTNVQLAYKRAGI